MKEAKKDWKKIQRKYNEKLNNWWNNWWNNLINVIDIIEKKVKIVFKELMEVKPHSKQAKAHN